MSFLISNAYAEAAPAAGQASDPITTLIFFGGFILIFYFILIRPQQKRAKEHRNLVANLGKGDEVVTNGGMLGKVTNVSEEYLSVELADNVTVRMQKSGIASVLPKGSLKAVAKEK